MIEQRENKKCEEWLAIIKRDLLIAMGHDPWRDLIPQDELAMVAEVAVTVMKLIVNLNGVPELSVELSWRAEMAECLLAELVLLGIDGVENIGTKTLRRAGVLAGGGTQYAGRC
jgi:hypothetical protein